MYLNLLFSCTFMKKQTAINNKNAISITRDCLHLTKELPSN